MPTRSASRQASATGARGLPGQQQFLLGRAPGWLRRKLLAEVAQRQNLETIVEDFVDDTVGIVEHLAHRGLVPFGDYTTLFREIPQKVDPSDQPVEPFEGGPRTVESDVVDRRLGPPSRRRGPDDLQRFSLARSSATTSS